ncbi:MAG: Glycoside hydrolase [Candidatus Tokpelaia hoelldobleri]|uniref:beta-N-acetylhexosaminidase n=1 Tax=Candidatus Tokpelaia hoelldobleri TaxID=1902579 RepID=A0A1U9JU68_9HYPH|nr:MAG: Glycoside hydrolase [Candidatus Tokpelaia hoelldoblerii]
MMKDCKAFITGVAGTVLGEDEKAFIAEYRPWGFILFARNVADGAQLRALIADLRAACGHAHAPVFVDQEGGRVQRLRPPLAPDYPAAAELGALCRRDRQAGLRAAWLMARLIALDLAKYGFNADCLPLLDIPVAGSHEVIGARAYGDNAEIVSEMGKMVAQGLQAGGLLPVMKHIPGHGRAFADTHKELARVDTPWDVLKATDFVPFKALNSLPCAMTSHVIYEAVDQDKPATLSARVIETVIRGEIGFDGLLLTDDLSMKALRGDFGELAHGALSAGCDVVLHCNGDMAEMLAVAENVPYLEGKALVRAQKAEKCIRSAESADETALRAEFAMLMSGNNPV